MDVLKEEKVKVEEEVVQMKERSKLLEKSHREKVDELTTAKQELETELEEFKESMTAQSNECAYTDSEVQKIVDRAQQVEQQQKQKISDLIDENHDLQSKLDKVVVVQEYTVSNQNQKIQYVLRLKQDNNNLKKQLAKMYNEMNRLTEQAPPDQTKELKALSMKVKKYKDEISQIKEDNKRVCKNMQKICDYIITRAVYSDEFKQRLQGQPTSKQAIESITYMARQIQQKEKELQQLRKSDEDYKVLLQSSK